MLNLFWIVAAALSLVGAVITTAALALTGTMALPCGFCWLFFAMCSMILLMIDVLAELKSLNAARTAENHATPRAAS